MDSNQKKEFDEMFQHFRAMCEKDGYLSRIEGHLRNKFDTPQPERDDLTTPPLLVLDEEVSPQTQQTNNKDKSVDLETANSTPHVEESQSNASNMPIISEGATSSGGNIDSRPITAAEIIDQELLKEPTNSDGVENVVVCEEVELTEDMNQHDQMNSEEPEPSDSDHPTLRIDSPRSVFEPYCTPEGKFQHRCTVCGREGLVRISMHKCKQPAEKIPKLKSQYKHSLPAIYSPTAFVKAQTHQKPPVASRYVHGHEGREPGVPGGAQISAHAAQRYLMLKYGEKSSKDMEVCKDALIKYLNRDITIEELYCLLKLGKEQEVKGFVNLMQSNMILFQQEVFQKRIKLKDLHWVFENISIESNRIIETFKSSLVADVLGPSASNMGNDVEDITDKTKIGTLRYDTCAQWNMTTQNEKTLNYIAIFTEDHILFCPQTTKLTKLPDKYEFVYKMLPNNKQGKVYLPTETEIFFQHVTSLEEFENFFLNIHNVQECSTLIRRPFMEHCFSCFEEKYGQEIHVEYGLIHEDKSNKVRTVLNNIFGSKMNGLEYHGQFAGELRMTSSQDSSQTLVRYACLDFSDYTLFLPQNFKLDIALKFRTSWFYGQELEGRICIHKGVKMMKTEFENKLIHIRIYEEDKDQNLLLLRFQDGSLQPIAFLAKNQLAEKYKKIMTDIKKAPSPKVLRSIISHKIKRREDPSSPSIHVLSMQPAKSGEKALKILEVLISSAKEVGGIDEKRGVQFENVQNRNVYKVGLTRNGHFEWLKIPLRPCNRAEDVAYAVNHHESILTSNETYKKAISRMKLAKANTVSSSVKESNHSKAPVESTNDCVVIDLFLATASQLIDIPGVCEEIAEEIMEARTNSNLQEFLDKGGFKILTEEIQYDVGLLARREMMVAYKHKWLDSTMLEQLELKVFEKEKESSQWMQRKPKVINEVMIAVLAALSGTIEIAKKFRKFFKTSLKEPIDNDLKWRQCARAVLALLPEKTKIATQIVVAKNTQEVINTHKHVSNTGMPALEFSRPTTVNDVDIIDIIETQSTTNTNDDILDKFALEVGLLPEDLTMSPTETFDVDQSIQTTNKPEATKENEIVLEPVNSDDCFSSDEEGEINLLNQENYTYSETLDHTTEQQEAGDLNLTKQVPENSAEELAQIQRTTGLEEASDVSSGMQEDTRMDISLGSLINSPENSCPVHPNEREGGNDLQAALTLPVNSIEADSNSSNFFGKSNVGSKKDEQTNDKLPPFETTESNVDEEQEKSSSQGKETSTHNIQDKENSSIDETTNQNEEESKQNLKVSPENKTVTEPILGDSIPLPHEDSMTPPENVTLDKIIYENKENPRTPLPGTQTIMREPGNSKRKWLDSVDNHSVDNSNEKQLKRTWSQGARQEARKSGELTSEEKGAVDKTLQSTSQPFASELKRKREKLKDLCRTKNAKKRTKRTERTSAAKSDDSSSDEEGMSKRVKRKPRKRIVTSSKIIDSSNDSGPDVTSIKVKRKPRKRIISSSTIVDSSNASESDGTSEASRKQRRLELPDSIELEKEELRTIQRTIDVQTPKEASPAKALVNPPIPKLIISKPKPIPKLVIKRPVQKERKELTLQELISSIKRDKVFHPVRLVLNPLTRDKIERMTKLKINEYFDEKVESEESKEARVNVGPTLEPAPKPAPEKTFKCDICSAQFGNLGSRHQHYLSSHMRKSPILARKSVLKCNICQKEFEESSSRHKHFLSVHCVGQKVLQMKPIKELKCVYCKQHFSNTEQRSQHYLNQHILKARAFERDYNKNFNGKDMSIASKDDSVQILQGTLPSESCIVSSSNREKLEEYKAAMVDSGSEDKACENKEDRPQDS